MRSKHHGMNELFKDKSKQEEYENHLHSLVEHDGKYYKLEDVKHSSTGRTSFGSGEHKGATEYHLHDDEKAYKKKLHKDRKTSSKPTDEADLKNRLVDSAYLGGSGVQKTKAFHVLKEREERPEMELHKEANDKTWKKYQVEQKAEEDAKEAKREAYIKEANIKGITKDLKGFDYSNSPIKELASLIKKKINRLNILKDNTEIIFINSKGDEKPSTWGKFKNWVLESSQNPEKADKPAAIKGIKQINFSDNKIEKAFNFITC